MPITGVVGVTFSLYQNQQGGAPLWIEVQNVQANVNGHYTAMLGSGTSGGVPQDIFSSAEAHWVGTQISGQREQPRVLLLSVPYALKAADAETLGGLPASAFVHAAPNAAIGAPGAKTTSAANAPPPAGVTGKGTKNFIPIWTSGTALGNSIIYETAGNLGVGTKTPKATLDVASTNALGIQSTVPGTEAAISGIATATSGGATGVYGRSSDPSSGGVIGKDNATTGGAGVLGVSAATGGAGVGVYGLETGTTGGVFGVIGQAKSTGEYSTGVYGIEDATTGAVDGVVGTAQSTTDSAAGVAGVENAATGVVYGVSGGTSSTTNGAAGVYGYEHATTGQVYGVSGFTTSNGDFAAGVSGTASATSGQVYGVVGVSNSTAIGAAAVDGYEPATSGQVYGVFGSTTSATNGAAGVAGNANATTGQVTGVAGTSVSTSGTGVFGNATAATGDTFGVFGQTASPSGIGTSGYASATNGIAIGVEGLTNSPAGAGAAFTNLAGGTSLVIIGNGANYKQIFNVDASGNGFFAGNLNVTGKLTKGSGSFKIDHPLDPGNKYLSHSFVESPDMMNVYNGNVITDRHGFATVLLPDYFEALNGDFRYQLTVMGKFAQAIVAKEIANNRFIIQTSKPGVKVSWQVTGIRHDAYANAYRIPTEEDKPAAEQGYYLHPEVFGQPTSKSIQAASSKTTSTDQIARAINP